MKAEGDGKTAEGLIDAHGEKEGGNNVSTGASLMAGTFPLAPTGRMNDYEGNTSSHPHPPPSTSLSSAPLLASK